MGPVRRRRWACRDWSAARVSGPWRAFVLAAVTIAAMSSEDASAQRVAVVAKTVNTISHGSLSPGVVLIADGKIEEVRAGTETPPGYSVIDASDRIVMPGLVDAHTHYGLRNVHLTPGRFDMAESSQPFTPQADVRDALDPDDPVFDKVRGLGATTLLVLPGSSNLVSGLGWVLKNRDGGLDRMLIGSRPVLKMALGMNPKSAHGRRERSPKTRMGSSAMLRARFEEAARLVRQGEPRQAGEVDRELEVLAAAVAGEALVHIHAVRADDILTALRLMRSYGLEGSLGHVYEGYLVADEIARSGVPVVVGPKLDGWYRGRNPPRPVDVSGRLGKAGVEVSIMTDSYVPDLFLQACFAVHLGMEEEEALRAITLNPARAIGLADRVGSLEPGKDADLIVLDGEPLALSTNVVRVLIEGETVYERAATE